MTDAIWSPQIDKCNGKQRGATIVEAALVLPAFFLLVLAIFEFGLVYSAYQTMLGAAREGARYAVIPDPNSTPPYTLPQNSDVATQVCNKIQAGVFGVGNITACTGGTPGTIASGTCPAASGTQPTLSAENVYIGQCTVTVNIGSLKNEGTETYVQVAVRRKVQLFWGWQIPITAYAVMRSEAN
jgi:Flp pilus assembly protein TadG